MKAQVKNLKFKGKLYKQYRGMGSIEQCLQALKTDIFKKISKINQKFVPEGVEGRVEYKGSVSKIIYQLKGGLRSSMGYIGAKNLNQISKNAKFTKITKAGFYESMVHSVEITQKQLIINYDKKISKVVIIIFFLSSSILEANNQYF